MIILFDYKKYEKKKMKKEEKKYFQFLYKKHINKMMKNILLSINYFVIVQNVKDEDIGINDIFDIIIFNTKNKSIINEKKIIKQSRSIQFLIIFFSTF